MRGHRDGASETLYPNWLSRVASFQLTMSTLKVRKLRKFRCVKIFCHPIHCPLEDGQTGCFLNKKNFVLALIVSATKTCAVLFVSTGLAGWWVVRKTNELWVKVMSWNLDEHWTAPLCFLCHAKAFPPRAGLIVYCCGHWLSITTKGSTSAASCKSNYLCFYVGK